MLLFNRYEYQPSTDLIGKGELSRVYKAMDKEVGGPVVVKIYRGNDRSEQIGLSDAGRFLALEHPNLCRYLHIEDIEREGAFGETEKMQVCIQELVAGGDLAAFYKKHSDLGMLKELVTGILHGLDYLHGQGVIHRRIKASNLLIAETASGPEVKIVDFGLGAGQAGDPGAKDANFSAVVVAVPHMAPEQFNVRKYGIDGKVSYNIDFWSLGITLYEVITGESLFRNSPEDSRELVIKNILDAAPPEKLGRLPQPFDRLVARCIVKQADQRVRSAEELLEILAGSEGDTVQLEEPVRGSDDTQVLVIKERPASDDTQVVPAAKVKPVVSDDTQVLPRAAMERASDDTQVLPRATSDDTQVLKRPASDDTQILPAAKAKAVVSDDTQVLPRAASDDTQVLPRSVSDDTQVLPVREQGPPPPPPPPQAPPPPPPPPVRSEEMQSLFNRYEYSARTGLIGKGGFSRVYKAYDKKLNRWVALKIYKTSEFSDRYSPIAEIRRVINLDHPNICRYLDIEEIEKENGFGEKELTQICVMELLDGGNLLEYYSAHRTEQALRKLVNDVLNGLAYLHKNGIIHRDIKPANILIRETYDGPVAKITDFGISKLSDSVNNNSSSALVVSIPYMAPEQLNVKKYGIQEKISFNLDLWALGVTIYELITGKILFKNSDQDSSEQIMTNIMAPGVPDKIAELPQPFYDIVYRCLVKDARERAQKADELIVLLNRTVPESRQAAGIAAAAGVAAPVTVVAAPVAVVAAGTAGKAGVEGPGKTAEEPAKVAADVPRKGTGFSVSAEEETVVKQGQGKHEKTVGFLRIAVVAAAVVLGISLYIYFQNRKMKQAVTFSAQKADSVSIVDQPAAQKSGTATDTISQAASSQGPASAGQGSPASASPQAGAGQPANGSGSATDPGAGKSGTTASGGTSGKSTHGTAGHVAGAGTGATGGGSAAASTTGATGTGAGDAGSGTAGATGGTGTPGNGTGAAGGATKSAGTTAAEDTAAMAGYSEPAKKDKPADSKSNTGIKSSNVGSKGSAGLASKYVLMLTTSQTCSISINNIPYGTLNNGRTMKLYLVPGAYVINATSTAHKSKQYTGRLEVKQEMLDQVGEFKIQL